MSSDLSGFTRLSEQLAALGREGAEELTTLLNSCFERMIAAVDRNGGDVLKFGGDALLILYQGDDHARRACRSALEMRTVVAEPLHARSGRRVQLRISQGMHSDVFNLFVVAGVHAELIVSGAAATRTVELEGRAEPGQILLSTATAAYLDPSSVAPVPEGALLRRLSSHAIDLTEPATVTLTQQRPRDDSLNHLVPELQRDQIDIGAPPEHRLVSVGFLKFAHSDQLPPQELLDRLITVGLAIDQATEEFGAHWLGTDVSPDGGKFILTAGAPVSRGADEDALLLSLRRILDTDVEINLRAGANSGHVFVGALGGTTRRAFTVMGDAVNLAARLMQHAGPGELVASKAILGSARTGFKVAWLDSFHVKGKSIAVEAATVDRVIESADSSLPRAVRLPLIGRDSELDALLGMVDSATEGHGGSIELTGDAGSGKTRLLEEARARRPDLRVAVVICGQYTRSSPYFAARTLLRIVLGIHHDAPPGEAGEWLQRLVDDHAPELRPWLPLLAVPLGADVPPTLESDRVAPAFRRAMTHRVMAELLTAIADQPLAIVVEDAQWVDDASAELLGVLAELAPGRPWAICISMRPGRSPLPEQSMLSIELGPLDRDEALELARASTGDAAALRPSDWMTVAERSGGNPLFVIELAAAATANGSSEALAESVESLVMARLDQVPASDRLALREAAVMGMVIDVRLLDRALEESGPHDAEGWRRLEAFLAPLGEDRLRFRHGLYRQVAYEGLSYGRRREVHRLVGEAIETTAGGRPEEHADLLSVHFHEAGAHDRAWRYSVLAGDLARAKSANVEAADFYRRALESSRWLPGLQEAEVGRIAEARGDVSELAANYDDAASSYADARRREVDEVTSVRLMRKLGLVRERAGRYPAALSWWTRALRGLERSSIDDACALAERARIELEIAGVRHRQGHYDEQIRWALKAAADSEVVGDQAAMARAYYLLESAFAVLGRPEADRYRSLALPIYEELADDIGRANVFNNLGITAQAAGRWQEAVELFEASGEAFEQAGDIVGAATAVLNRAEMMAYLGELEDARGLLNDAVNTFRSARYHHGSAYATGVLGHVLARLGRGEMGLELLAEAQASFEEMHAGWGVLEMQIRTIEALTLVGNAAAAVELAGEIGNSFDQADPDAMMIAHFHRHLAAALLELGDLDAAVLSARSAVDAAVESGLPYEEGRARNVLAEALMQVGDPSAVEQADAAAELLGAYSVLATISPRPTAV